MIGDNNRSQQITTDIWTESVSDESGGYIEENCSKIPRRKEARGYGEGKCFKTPRENEVSGYIEENSFKIPRRNESEGYGEIKCFEIPMWRGIGNESVDTDVAELLSKGSERK